MFFETDVGGLCHHLRTIQLVSPLGTRGQQQCHVYLGDAGSHIVFKAISAVKPKTRSVLSSMYCWLHCSQWVLPAASLKCLNLALCCSGRWVVCTTA
jgi:hypothetical protein